MTIPPDQTGPDDKLWNALHFAEERRTLWLNAMGIGRFGRHRGQVLYGFTTTEGISSSIVQVRPGALASAYGTTFIYDAVSIAGKSEIDLANPLENYLSPFDPLAEIPILVMVYMRYFVVNAREMKEIDSDTQFGTSDLKFAARAVPIRRDRIQAAKNILARDPILLDVDRVAPAGTIDQLVDYDLAAVDFPQAPGSAQSASQQYTDIPLCYYLIGVDPATNTKPTTLTDGAGQLNPGVVKIQQRNAFEQVGRFLGFDPLANLANKRVTSGPTNPDGSALQQGYRESVVGGFNFTELLAPRYGTGVPQDGSGEIGTNLDLGDDDRLSWANSEWDFYRRPSFLRDGDSLLWALRRLDYVLRLWMDRTGDQDLVSRIQDGSLVGSAPALRAMATMDAIVTHFHGGVGVGTNYNRIDWVSDLLINGPLTHNPATAGSTSADTHFTAIKATSLGIWHITTDILGRTFPAAAMRTSSSWRLSETALSAPVLGGDLAAVTAALTLEDGPVGALTPATTKAQNHPTVVIGDVIHAYGTIHPVYAALRIALERAQASHVNWLKNPNLLAGDLDSDVGQTVDPLHWETPFPLVTSWTRTEIVPALQIHETRVVMGIGGQLFQTVPVTNALLTTLAPDLNILHAAVALKVYSGTVQVGVRGYDSGAGLLFDIHSVDIDTALAPGYTNHGFVFRWDGDLSALDELEFYVIGTAGAPDVGILGASCGAGAPPQDCAYQPFNYDFMHRDGGLTSKMRGHLVLDGNDVFFGTDYADNVFTDRHLGGGVVAGTTVFTDPQLPDNTSLKPVLDEELARLNVGVGPNMLVNGRFAQTANGVYPDDVAPSDTFSNVAQPLRAWEFQGMLGTDTWTLDGGHVGDLDAEESWGSAFLADMADGGSMRQQIKEVGGTSTADLVGALAAAGGYLSATVILYANEALQLKIIGRDDGDVVQWSVTKTIPAGAVPRAHSVTVKIPVGSTMATVEVEVLNTSGSTASVVAFGARLNVGLPGPAVSRDERDFMPLGGSRRSPMRNHLYMGRDDTDLHLIRHLADCINDTDAVNKRSAFDIAISAVLAVLGTELVDAGVGPAPSPLGGTSTRTGTEVIIYDAALAAIYGGLLGPLVKTTPTPYMDESLQVFNGVYIIGRASHWELLNFELHNVGAQDTSTFLRFLRDKTSDAGGAGSLTPPNDLSYDLTADDNWQTVLLVTIGTASITVGAKLRWDGDQLKLQFRCVAVPWLVTTGNGGTVSAEFGYGTNLEPVVGPGVSFIPIIS